MFEALGTYIETFCVFMKYGVHRELLIWLLITTQDDCVEIIKTNNQPVYLTDCKNKQKTTLFRNGTKNVHSSEILVHFNSKYFKRPVLKTITGFSLPHKHCL